MSVSDKRVFPPVLDAIQPPWKTMSSPDNFACGIGEIGPGGETLTTRRPLKSGDNFPSLRHLPGGGFCTLQTSPISQGSAFSDRDVPVYKYHRWLWTMSGNLQLLEEAAGHTLPVPDHISSQQRDEGPDQEIFLQCLAFMQSYRLLRKPAPSLESIRRSFDAALSLIDTRYEGEANENQQFISTLVEQRVMLVRSMNTPLWIKFLGEGKNDPLDQELRTPMELQPPRAVLLSNIPAPADDWDELPENCTVIIDRYGRYFWEPFSP